MPPFPAYQFFTLSTPAEHIAHVEINRPEKLNAFFEPMWPELKAVFDHLSTDPDVRCILFSGKGDKAFCAGLDLTAATSTTSPLSPPSTPTDPSRRAALLRTHIQTLQSSVSALTQCRKPIIALLHGYVYGLGIDLAVACDIRLCSADARFSVKEVDIGIAADLGTLTRLPGVVGREGWVREVAYTAREWGGEEAREVGFVGGKVWGDKRAMVDGALGMARKIVEKSPVAVQATKEILDAREGKSVEDHLRYTAVVNSSVLQGQDVQRAIEALVKKKKARFERL